MSDDTTSDSGAKRVCVTGASGYVGCFVVQQLLEAGHHVRATVRDPADENKTAHLRAMAGVDRLELFAADLMQPGSFDEPVAGCQWVCHVASSVQLASRDPQREIVDPAVQGTENVLAAVRRAGTVQRVVLTSSMATVVDEKRLEGRVFTGDDWNESASLSDPYPLSKVLAERRAWQIHGAVPEQERYTLVTIHPSFVLGPLKARVHARSSPSFVRELLRRKLPGCPRMFFNLVDVRDVALAHLRALERPQVSGRLVACNNGLWMREMARILRRHFPDHRVPTRHLPDLAMYIGALFDKRLNWAWLRRNLGRRARLDGSRLPRELDVTYRPLEETVLDTARSMVELGLDRR